MFGFSDRPAKVEARYGIGGERPGQVYPIGRYEVTVYEDGEVTYRVPHGYTGDPRRTLPNLEIEDGQVKFALSDLIDDILARIQPEELAAALWENDEVKERFMYALSTRWSQDNIGDDDRRKFLGMVKDAIHDKALDRLGDAMAKVEYDISRAFNFWHEIGRVNDRLRDLDVRMTDGSLLQFQDRTMHGEFSIGGKVWTEARDHWREEVRERFSTPPEPASSSPADDPAPLTGAVEAVAGSNGGEGGDHAA